MKELWALFILLLAARVLLVGTAFAATEEVTQVKDINPGPGDGVPGYINLTAVGESLFFQGFEGPTGFELWKSDGTEAGTVLVKDINPAIFSSDPSQLRLIGTTIFFSVDDGTTGEELWKAITAAPTPTPTPPPTPVPGLTQWGLIAMAVMFGILLLRSISRNIGGRST